MPGLARKLLIFAVVDGVILQPLTTRGQRPAPSVKVGYKSAEIKPLLGTAEEKSGADESKGFEAFGVVGILNFPGSPYLISITRRHLVAQIHGKPVFVVSEVALTPLSSRKDADTSIARTKAGLQKRAADKSLDETDSEDDDDHSVAAIDDVEDEEVHTDATESGQSTGSAPDSLHKRTSSIAEDVIARRGFGSFLMRRGTSLGLNISELQGKKDEPLVVVDTKASGGSINDKNEGTEKGNDTALLPKLIKTSQLLFGSSRSFFFSYDFDITRSVSSPLALDASDVPLFRKVDPLFFWNRNVIQPFIDARQNHIVLPLMQGFVGQRSFTVEKDPTGLHPVENTAVVTKEEDMPLGSKSGASASQADPETNDEEAALSMDDVDKSTSKLPDDTSEPRIKTDNAQSFLLTLVSRRSVKRAGLRYLRRGVDEEGNAANFVETEQILSRPDWSASSKTYSFLQIRGSIPIFFSQSPYSFKPIPQLQHSVETNFSAFRKHFSALTARYGSLQVASLVEKHGNEAIVGNKLVENMTRLNESGGVDGAHVGFEWFDFHAICKGMKFEKVSLLLDALAPQLDSFGHSIEQDGKLVSKQCGILRTNCMDCLDRTNVVQSAAGRRALENQLQLEGIDLSAQKDQRTEWFNTLWADNGDAISNQYASTAALKGDYTRTKKRNYQGALKDMGLSISRFYSGIVNDYFSQAAIDFLVGNVTGMVFEDFETNLMSQDPSVSLQKMRQQAIDVSQKLVVADDGEELMGGWALLCPHESNTIKSTPFEESVLLLTDAAIYACRFDWNIEKVSSFERVDLRHVVGIRWGAYVTSILSAAQADEKRNVGFVVSYKAGIYDIRRVNTRSITSRDESDLLEGTSVVRSDNAGSSGKTATPKTRTLAWKALPARSSVSGDTEAKYMSETEQVTMICSEIERAINALQLIDEGSGRKSIVEHSDIISLAEAKKSTGLLDQLSYSLKKLVWAS